MRTVVAIILALLAVPASAQSVSSVSGTLTHGSSVTISGSSFGTGSAPLKYDDFQSVTLGANITTSSASGPAWSNNGGGSQQFNPVASATLLRSGTPFTRNMQSHWQPSGSGADSSNVSLTGQTLSVLYLDFWLYNDWSGAGSLGGENVKHVRLHQASAGNPNLGLTDEGPVPGTFYACAGDSRFADTPTCSGYTDTTAMYGAWIHVQWLLDPMGGGSNLGKVRTYVNGTLTINRDDVYLLNTGFTSWPEVYVGNYVRTADYTGNVYAYWENFYIGQTWARVEICDSSTKAGAHCEIQIPSAWADTSITATLNRGSFAALSSLYLFVCNSANTCGTGYQLTAAGTGGIRLRRIPPDLLFLAGCIPVIWRRRAAA